MKENIEVKDVQRTEYLDKNGLDMLWTKVKENTHNQVEVERNRAVAKENSITNSLSEFVSKTTTDAQSLKSQLEVSNSLHIIDGSNTDSHATITCDGISNADNNANHVYATDGSLADLTQYAKAAALNNYVLTTALDKQVDTLNAAISGKQDAGNYIPYKNIAFKNKYVIEPSYSIEFRTDAINYKYGKASIGPQAISIANASGQRTAVDPEEILIKQSGNAPGTIHSTLNTDSFGVYSNYDDSVIFKLNQYGIKLKDGDNNHVLTSNASTIDITQYALKSVYDEKIAALDEKVTANTTAIEGKQDAGNYIPFDKSDTQFYKINKPLKYKTTYNEFSLADGYMIHAKDTQSDFGVMSGGITFTTGDKKLIFDPLSISIHEREYCNVRINKSEITLGDETYAGLRVKITSDGIKFKNRKNTEVPVADGSGFADLNDYAKKSELPTAATKENLGVVKVGDGLNVTDGVISVAQDYIIDMMSYGVEWDTTVADPTCTRIGNPLYHKQLPIQSQYKGCLVKNGKVNYYLDPNDWSKKANGTPSVLDGTDGDVMIHTPKFYGKSGSNGNKRWVRISTIKVDASWVEIPEMFISAYHNTVYADGDVTKVASVVSTDKKYRGGGRRSEYDEYLTTDQFRTDLGKPISNISRATMRTYAAATGQELLCYEFYKWIFYWNYVIEYANFNSQKEFNSELTSDGYHQGGLGPGVTQLQYSQWGFYNDSNPLTPCGYTNEFGNFSGVKQMVIPAVETPDGITVGDDTTLYANRWRGFENPFGDILTNLEGIIIKRDAAKANSNVYTTTDALKYGDDYSLFDIAGVEIAQDGWIKAFNLGSNAEIIPSSIEGSESTYKCDYHWCYVDSTEKRTLLVGGRAIVGGKSGLGFFSSTDGVGYAASNVGFRSLVRV